MPKVNLTVQSRINRWKKKTLITPEGCWRYLGTCHRDGHAMVQWNGRPWYLSRIIAHIFHGLNLKSKNQQGNHKPECKFVDCWNPNHIYVGTQSENIGDSVEAGTHAVRHLNSRKYKNATG